MNNYPEVASTFKGACLLSIQMEDSNDPSFKNIDLN